MLVCSSSSSSSSSGCITVSDIKEDESKFNGVGGFPDDFLFGASSSSYQYEGAANEGGKWPSIWDSFTHKFPEKMANGSNGDVAEDFYHRYIEDVQLMKFIGLDSFRFSISWPRVLPTGKLSGGINKEGVAFYNNLINQLLENGIKPFVTMFHWDLPQALEDEYGGFLSPRIVEDFSDFAELCFKEFGDRVKHWTTINEPYMYAKFGYDEGLFPPGRCSSWRSNGCFAGDSATEPYTVVHHMLLSHAKSVNRYRVKYQASQKGKIGIIFPSHWMVPYSNTKTDQEATQRALDFMYGWYMNPLVYGNYPKIMRTLVAKRLPTFTAEQTRLVKGSFDFIGLNYYTTMYVADAPSNEDINITMSTDSQTNFIGERDGEPIGPPTAMDTFNVYPQGLTELLVYTKEKYNNPAIFITENGMANANNRTAKEEIEDHNRVEFFRSHILAVRQAIEEGVDVKGYYAWTFLDTFEWTSGYTLRFGLNYVDYEDGLKRYVKASGLWFKKFLLNKDYLENPKTNISTRNFQ